MYLMGSITDPIYVKVSSHTQSPDGTTRNDVFYMTSTLNAYASSLRALATPVYAQVAAETQAVGALLGLGAQYVNDTYLGKASGGPCSLKAEVGIGLQALATPTKYHLVKWDQFTPSDAQSIYNWIDGILQKMIPLNLYQGATYTNG